MIIANFVRNRDAGGKFVVLTPADSDGQAYFLISDFSLDSQHAHIVRRWRASFAASVPPLVRISGGGWWRYHSSPPARLELYGSSAAYGRFDPRYVEKHLSPGSILGEAVIAFGD
ncbi:MAG: hypothetical protein LIP23_08385 [Planctomycetes bacterium]|nr:hypothetical protein [Planctomycetota bacterium]